VLEDLEDVRSTPVSPTCTTCAWTISDGFDAVAVHVVLDGTAHGTDVARESANGSARAPRHHVTVQPEAPPFSPALRRRKFAPEPQGMKAAARPFLKWAGGKVSFSASFDLRFPQLWSLLRPFLGGGASFSTCCRRAC
jgi:hypothetical protein